MRALPYLSFGTQIGAESQRLYLAMGALGLAILPHLFHLPLWIPALIAVAAAWRVAIEVRTWRLPPRWLRILFAMTGMLLVALTFRTINGLDAGSALLATMAGIKLLETRGTRDCTMLIFIGYVLLFAALLYDQSLLRLPYLLAASWLLTAALLRLHQTAQPVRTRVALRTTGIMLLQALPVAILLFLFFPRLPGQFWALPSRDNAASGLSDEMTPGDISELTLSGETAFRVKFDGPVPAAIDRYWRGPVLHDFDGRSWRRERARIETAQEIAVEGPAYTYRITLEPTQREWLFALDLPTQWPDDVLRLHDLQLVTRHPITTLSSFTLQSHTSYRTPLTLRAMLRVRDSALPGGANPRTREFARALRASVQSDAAFVQTVLDKFQREEFFYTLTPPLLGDDSVDQFLFDTRRGFCEHFASAFATIMRAANIPARIVTGYQGGEYNSIGDYLLIRQSDAHAWTEVWLADRGWVRVDPTAAVAPQRVERNLDAAIADSEFLPGRFLRTNLFISRVRLTWDAVNNFWNDRIVQYNELKQRSLLERLGIKDADYRVLAIGFALVLLLFFLVLTAYLGWQYRPRKRDPVGAVYDELCRKLARVNVTRLGYEGPKDYLQRAAEAQPRLAVDLRELRELYTSLRYGPDPLNSELSRLKYLVNRLQPRANAH